MSRGLLLALRALPEDGTLRDAQNIKKQSEDPAVSVSVPREPHTCPEMKMKIFERFMVEKINSLSQKLPDFCCNAATPIDVIRKKDNNVDLMNDVSEEIKTIHSSSTSGKDKGPQKDSLKPTRQPKCAKCRNHHVIVILKGHKRHCQYKDPHPCEERHCRVKRPHDCHACYITTKRRSIMAKNVAQIRHQDEDERRRAAGLRVDEMKVDTSEEEEVDMDEEGEGEEEGEALGDTLKTSSRVSMSCLYSEAKEVTPAEYLKLLEYVRLAFPFGPDKLNAGGLSVGDPGYFNELSQIHQELINLSELCAQAMSMVAHIQAARDDEGRSAENRRKSFISTQHSLNGKKGQKGDIDEMDTISSSSTRYSEATITSFPSPPLGNEGYLSREIERPLNLSVNKVPSYCQTLSPPLPAQSLTPQYMAPFQSVTPQVPFHPDIPFPRKMAFSIDSLLDCKDEADKCFPLMRDLTPLSQLQGMCSSGMGGGGTNIRVHALPPSPLYVTSDGS